jgi:hypothetical protein
MPETSNLFHLTSHIPRFVTGQEKNMGHYFLGILHENINIQWIGEKFH